jgi:hypothetical protein
MWRALLICSALLRRSTNQTFSGLNVSLDYRAKRMELSTGLWPK